MLFRTTVAISLDNHMKYTNILLGNIQGAFDVYGRW
jgi:hypothetical protein